MNKLVIVILTGLLLMAGVTPGHAQDETESRAKSRSSKGDSYLYIQPVYGNYSFKYDDFEASTFTGARLGFQLQGSGILDSIGIEGFYASLDADSTDNDGSAKGTMYHLGGIYNLPFGKLVPFFKAGAGWVDFESDNNSYNSPVFTSGFGVKYALTRFFDLRADFGYVLLYEPGIKGDIECSVGLSFNLGKEPPVRPAPPPDADHDGVPDRVDKCPDTPRGSKPDEFGCIPEIDGDDDGDGVANSKDKCADTPSGAPVDAAGCELDNDRDGVVDEQDECPGTPPGIRVDERGCVATTAPDAAAAAAIAEVPAPMAETPTAMVEEPVAAVTEPPAITAAPAATVAVPAVVAAAPQVAAEVPAAKAEAPAEQAELPVLLPLVIEFAFDRTYIKPKYHAKLQELADMLKAEEDIEVLIDGHTDSIGKVNYNKRLGRRRAENVKAFLVNLGVAPERIFTRGFGSEFPVADNRTEEGRQRNRRAVVTIAEEPPQ